jgi:hypothetical protein
MKADGAGDALTRSLIHATTPRGFAKDVQVPASARDAGAFWPVGMSVAAQRFALDTLATRGAVRSTTMAIAETNAQHAT